ncbi:MAG: 3-phosphoglycerate dehydrogenase [Ruminococcaceae bacterium]|nr:3-phosphoglycerate dehydrogenase [Oscillospiraceae bacterium]
MNIQLLNKIAKVGLDQLGDGYQVGEEIANPDGIMVRSAVMHDMEFGADLKAIARAGAGVNNIPIERCSAEGIVVFNTPGANANGVKELAVCALLLAARNIIGGIEWAKSLAGTADVAKQVEKGKSKFAGTELQGKTLGVIGLGAIGGMIANTAIALGMNVIGCDPFLSVEGAWNLDHNIKRAATYDEIFEKADYITLHVPATKDTKNMICTENIAKMKDGAKIINLSRADLVNAAELKVALADGKISAYVTDFPTEDILDGVNVVAIPHLGASTEESEDNCAVMAAKELDDYLVNGNITNSVNFPNLTMPRTGAARICVLHANVPAIITKITAALADEGLNIENMTNKSKGDNAYTVADVANAPSADAIARIAAVEGVYKVRAI